MTEKVSLGVLAVVVSVVASGCGAQAMMSPGASSPSGGPLGTPAAMANDRPAPIPEHVHRSGTRVSHISPRTGLRR